MMILTEKRVNEIYRLMSPPTSLIGSIGVTQVWQSCALPDGPLEDLLECFNMLSRNLCFVSGGIYSLDDDKHRHASKSLDELGYAVLNIKSNLGTVLHAISSSITGLYVGGLIQPLGCTKLGIVKSLMSQIIGHGDLTRLSQFFGCIALDRGYSIEEVIEFLVMHNVLFIGTVPKHKKVNAFCNGLPEKGPVAVYGASRRINGGGDVHQIAYREKSGKDMAVLQTNLPHLNRPWQLMDVARFPQLLGGETPSRTVFHADDDLRSDTDDENVGRLSSLGTSLVELFRSPVTVPETAEDFARSLESHLVFLTKHQNVKDRAWYLSRLGRVTSTIAHELTSLIKTLRTRELVMDPDVLSFELPPDENLAEPGFIVRLSASQLVELLDYLKLPAPKATTTRNVIESFLLSYHEMEPRGLLEFLMNCNVDALKVAIRRRNLPVTGNKIQLCERLVDDVTAGSPGQGSINVQELIVSWYFRRLPQVDNLRVGRVNEARVLTALPDAIKTRTPLKLVLLKTLGLVSRVDNDMLASSVDGFAVLEGDCTFAAAVEIKTKVAAVSVAAEIFAQVDITDVERVKQLIPEIPYRTQCVHHCVVLGVQKCLLVYASTCEITRFVLVNVPTSYREAYVSDVSRFIQTYQGVFDVLRGRTNVLPDPLVNSLNAPESRLKQLVGDSFSLRYVGLLAKYLEEWQPSVEDGGPVALKWIKPAIVSCWNRVKGGVDKVSRLLANIKVPRQGLQFHGFIVMRILLLGICNTHLLYRIAKMDRRVIEDLKSYDRLLESLNESESLQTSIRHLPDALVMSESWARQGEFARQMPGTTTPQQTPTQTCSPPTSRRRTREPVTSALSPVRRHKKEKWSHNERRKEIRLSHDLDHSKVLMNKQMWCAFCSMTAPVDGRLAHQGFKTKFRCSTCNEALCIVTRGSNRKSCFEKWHSQERLQQ